MEKYIIEVLKQENEYLRLIINDSLNQSLQACKNAEFLIRETKQKFDIYESKKKIEFDDEIKDILPLLPPSPKISDDTEAMKMFNSEEYLKKYSLYIYFEKQPNIENINLIQYFTDYFKQFFWLGPIRNVKVNWLNESIKSTLNLIPPPIMEIEFFCQHYQTQALKSFQLITKLFDTEIKKIYKFDREAFIHACSTKTLTFLLNLENVSILKDFQKEKFTFSTLLNFLETCYKFDIFYYEICFDSVKIFNDEFIILFNDLHTYMSFDDCFKLKQKFYEVGILL